MDGGALLPLNTWSHVALTYDSATATVKSYVNGGSPTRVVTNITGSLPTFNGSFRIGTRTNGTSFWAGLIDEVELFGRALSQSEIQGIVDAGSSGKCRPTPTPNSNRNADSNGHCNVHSDAYSNGYFYAYSHSYSDLYAYAYPKADCNGHSNVHSDAYSNGYFYTYSHSYSDLYANAYANAYAYPKTTHNQRTLLTNSQYIYNLRSSALGPVTYRVDIKINGNVVGNAIFQLN